MKNRIVSIGLLACVFFCHASTMHAQTLAQASPEAPVLPMDIKFRSVPQYFEQSFPDDPRYARIVAMVDHGRCDVILLDKTTNRSNTLWIFFGPLLPLPAHQINDQTTVAFTVAENEQATVASGALEVQRTVDTEHPLWRFDTPNLARNAIFEKGVHLILSASEQATCVNRYCLLRSPNR
jgi:hypothetical protein